MVGVICNDTGRYNMFWIAKDALRSPVNTKIQTVLTGDRILGRNKLAKMAVEEGQEWLMFLDDDHVFPTKPAAFIYQDAVFGTFMFQDKDAPLAPQ